VLITLYGWKLYPVEALCDDAVPGIEAPNVDRAV
jgi:hypothetical protein